MVSSFIDGSFIYGSGEVWANAIRNFSNGLLLSDGANRFPAVNNIGIPLRMYKSPSTDGLTEPKKLWSECLSIELFVHANELISRNLINSCL